MRALDLYNQNNTPQEGPAPSLYSDVKTPFSKLPPIVERALSSHESPAEVVLRPRVDLLSKFRTATVQDNTKVVPQDIIPNLKLPTIDEKQPTLPTGASIREKLTGFNADQFTKETYKQESGGDYTAWSKTSSATGKYQFLWGKKPGQGWGDDIRRVTGVTSREQFRDSPKAQEKFYNFYLENHIKPAVKKLSSQGAKFGLSPTEVARVVHFQGEEGARTAFEHGVKALYAKAKGNPSIMAYLGKHKDKS